jgi:hypothetical protein
MSTFPSMQASVHVTMTLDDLITAQVQTINIEEFVIYVLRMVPLRTFRSRESRWFRATEPQPERRYKPIFYLLLIASFVINLLHWLHWPHRPRPRPRCVSRWLGHVLRALGQHYHTLTDGGSVRCARQLYATLFVPQRSCIEITLALDSREGRFG